MGLVQSSNRMPGTYLPGTYQTREILIQICYPLPNGGFDSFELPFLNSLVIGSVCVCVTCVCYWSYPLPNGGLGFRVDSFELPFLMILMKQDSWAHGFHGPCPKFQSPNRRNQRNQRRGRRGVCAVCVCVPPSHTWFQLLEFSCLSPSPYRSDTLVGRALNSNQEH